MKDGIPNPESGVLIFEAQIKLDRLARIGKTPYGDRRVAVGLEGSISGPKLAGKVMTGALDYELTLSNGAVEVEDLLVFQTDDGKYIYSRSAGVGADAKDVRIAMDFEAPNGSASEWLNTGKYVARRILDEPAKTLTLRVYDVSNVAVKTDAANVIRIAKPDGVPPQPWNYRQKDAAEKPGKELIVESVGLSPSQRVGASKRGNRNIIPITGGDLSGRITGKVLSGGADYQNLSGGGPAIDAHYLWQASDGEIIIVRNTTSTLGGLVPIVRNPRRRPLRLSQHRQVSEFQPRHGERRRQDHHVRQHKLTSRRHHAIPANTHLDPDFDVRSDGSRRGLRHEQFRAGRHTGQDPPRQLHAEGQPAHRTQSGRD